MFHFSVLISSPHKIWNTTERKHKISLTLTNDYPYRLITMVSTTRSASCANKENVRPNGQTQQRSSIAQPHQQDQVQHRNQPPQPQQQQPIVRAISSLGLLDLYHGDLGDFTIEHNHHDQHQQQLQQLQHQQRSSSSSTHCGSTTHTSTVTPPPSSPTTVISKIFDETDKMMLMDIDPTYMDNDDDARMNTIFNIIDDVLLLVNEEDFDSLFWETSTWFFLESG